MSDAYYLSIGIPPPPKCPLPDIPNTIRNPTRIYINDLNDMIREIEWFKNDYFSIGNTYSKINTNNDYGKDTDEVFQEFQDLMFCQTDNWKGYEEYNNNIRKFPFHGNNFKTYKLCTRNLFRFRQCCDDRIYSIMNTIKHLEC